MKPIRWPRAQYSSSGGSHRESKVKVSSFGIKQEAAGVFTENVVSPHSLLLYQTSSIFVTSAAWSGFGAVVGVL